MGSLPSLGLVSPPNIPVKMGAACGGILTERKKSQGSEQARVGAGPCSSLSDGGENGVLGMFMSLFSITIIPQVINC